jgi:predicted glycosyltransferase
MSNPVARFSILESFSTVVSPDVVLIEEHPRGVLASIPAAQELSDLPE